VDPASPDCDDVVMRAAWTPTTASLAWILPGLLVFTATTALVVSHGFAGMYGQDSFGYVNYALGPLRDALARGEGPPPWPQPPGYPMAVAGISLLAGADGRIGLGISLVAGALVPLLTALLAAETVGRGLNGRAVLALPILAALLAALPGQLWQSSAVAMSDTLSVALATGAAWAACRYARTGRAGWLIVAAAAAAAAIDTRWVFGLVAIPITLVGLVGIGRVWRLDRPRAVRDAAVATVVAAAVVAPVLGPMARAVLDGAAVPFAADFGAYHWDPANALRTTFETTDGRLSYGLTSGAFYLGQAVAPYWFGPLGLFALWGAVWVARQGGRTAAVVLIGWPLVVLVFLAGSPYQNTRFFLGVMPPVATLIAVGLWRLASAVDTRAGTNRRSVVAALAVAFAAGWLVVAVVLAGRFTTAFIDRQVRDLAATRSLEAQVPRGARLVSMGPTGVFVYDGLPDVVELYGLDPDAATTLLADGRPSYLVIDPVAIAGQWAGRGPALTVEAIRAGRGLTRIDEAGSWTLYRIGSP